MLNDMKRILLIVAIISTSFTVNAQCSMCRAVVENNSENLAEGLNNGILFLMVFPYLFIGGIGYLLYKKFKSNQAEFSV